MQPFFQTDDGAFTLYEGDCRELLSGLPEASVDLIFADPPYNLSNGGTTCYAGRRAPVDKGAWDRSAGIEADHLFHQQWLAACLRVLKPSGTIWVSGTHHAIFSIGYAMQTLGYHLLNLVTWTKTNAPPHLACRMFAHSSELLIWAAPQRGPRLLHTFHYDDMKDENGGKQMRDIWGFNPDDDETIPGGIWPIPTPPRREKRHGKHPTQKPLELLRRIVRACTNPGDIVLDPFNGSGTTGLAALEYGCRYIGIEREPMYLELSTRRVCDVLPQAV